MLSEDRASQKRSSIAVEASPTLVEIVCIGRTAKRARVNEIVNLNKQRLLYKFV